MDYIESEKLFAFGWICGLHPRLFNRNDLKSWIDSLDEDHKIGPKIKLHPRTIFTVDESGKKTITNGIIIDGAVEDAKEIMTFLYSIDWSKQYGNATFVPFRTSASLTKSDQDKAMEFHKNYLHNTFRKLVRIANPTDVFEVENGINISFRTRLLQSQLHGVSMIQGVEKMKDGIVRIIYHKDNQTGIDSIMDTLRENIIDAFGHAVAKSILGDDFELVSHYGSEMEDQHTAKIKSAWEGKLISHKSPLKKSHQLYYGSNKSESLYKQGETKSFSEITQSTMSMSDTQVNESKRESEELRNMVIDLQNKFSSLEQSQQSFRQSLKSNLKAELVKEFEGSIEDFRTEMNTTITTIENKFDNTIQTYEKNAIEREERLNNQSISNFRTVAAELLTQSTTVTPSETNQMSSSLRGRAR